jgi:hypothetical protein
MIKKPIIIPEPCHQNWDAMTPNEQGRHCTSCVNTVVDVTCMTDDEIWKKHKQNNNNLCVRIPSHRVSFAPKNGFHQLKVAAIAALIGFWLSVKQAVFAQSDSTSSNKNKVPRDSNQVILKIVINGIVSDSIDRMNALAFCNISVLQNDKVIGGGYTDFEGKFTISLSGNFNTNEKLILQCNTVGYKKAKKAFTPKDSLQCDIYMNESHICLHEAVITMRRDDSYIVGNLPITMGVMVTVKQGRTRRKLLNQYDTKTYYSDEIERYNLGR